MSRLAKTSTPAAASPPRRPTGRPKKDGRRVGADELIRQCVSLLDESPPAKVTFSALARHANVTAGLVNYYFKDRSELMLGVLRHLMDELSQNVIEARTAPAEEQLRSFIGFLLQLHIRRPYFYEILLEQFIDSPTPESRALFEETTNKGISALKSIIDDGAVEGTMRPAGPDYVYVTILGMCEFVVTGRIILRFVDTVTEDAELTNRYADQVFRMAMGDLAPNERRETQAG